MNHKKEQEEFYASLREAFAQSFLEMRSNIKGAGKFTQPYSGADEKDISELERIYKL